MTMIAPVRCKCGLNMETLSAAPIAVGAKTVTVSMCRECDKRRCKDCEQYVQSLTDIRCGLGHLL